VKQKTPKQAGGGKAAAPTPRIAKVATVALRHPIDGALRNPLFKWSEKITLLVFVGTEDGTIGVGEAWCALGSPAPIEAFIKNDVEPELIGQDVTLSEAIVKSFRRRTALSSRKSETDKALSAIDIALWDIKGKLARMPVWRLLGGCDARVRAYASGGLYRDGQSPEAFAEVHAREVRSGFGAVKIKVGGASLPEDVARVGALREAIGPDATLMVDGVASLSVPRATELARALVPFRIKWFEQPLVNENIEGLAAVRRDGGLPIAGNENEAGLDAFRRLIGSGAVDYVQFDPVVSGGFTEGRKIAALAEAYHLPVTIHHSNSVVSMLANVHLAAAVPNCDSIEYHMIHRQLFGEVPADWLTAKDGHLTAPEAPGLGVDLSAYVPW
jgi:L-alanine-DL-glutamate epimerase-like enolase superfamily enzyme